MVRAVDRYSARGTDSYRPGRTHHRLRLAEQKNVARDRSAPSRRSAAEAGDCGATIVDGVSPRLNSGRRADPRGGEVSAEWRRRRDCGHRPIATRKEIQHGKHGRHDRDRQDSSCDCSQALTGEPHLHICLTLIWPRARYPFSSHLPTAPSRTSGHRGLRGSRAQRAGSRRPFLRICQLP